MTPSKSTSSPRYSRIWLLKTDCSLYTVSWFKPPNPFARFAFGPPRMKPRVTRAPRVPHASGKPSRLEHDGDSGAFAREPQQAPKRNPGRIRGLCPAG